MSEANKAVVRKVVEEIWNRGNLAAIDELMAPDFVNRDPANPGVTDRESLRQSVAAFIKAFPDRHVVVEELIAEGDKVAKRWSNRATHRGEFKGIPPTNNPVSVTGISIYRVAGGRVAECTWSYDALGLMRQLGVLPKP